MNYLTMDELAEFLSFNTRTVRIFLEHFTLSKHLLRKKMLIGTQKRKQRIKVIFKINEQSLYDLEKYLNMKGNKYNDFEKDIREFCKLKRGINE